MTIVVRKVAFRQIELVRYEGEERVGLGMCINMPQARLSAMWEDARVRMERIMAREQAQDEPVVPRKKVKKPRDLSARAAELAFHWGKSLTTKRNRRQLA